MGSDRAKKRERAYQEWLQNQRSTSSQASTDPRPANDRQAANQAKYPAISDALNTIRSAFPEAKLAMVWPLTLEMAQDFWPSRTNDELRAEVALQGKLFAQEYGLDPEEVVRAALLNEKTPLPEHRRWSRRNP